MIDVSEEPCPLAAAWESTEKQTQLPEPVESFLDCAGLTPLPAGCRRAYRRFHIRSKAILSRDGVRMGVYTCDGSRGGIGLLSPVELMRDERVAIRLPKTKEFQIQIVRCRRIDEQCYECGAVFVLGVK